MYSTEQAQMQTSSSAPAASFAQPKLKIGAPDDAHEQEADRVADRVAGENKSGGAQGQDVFAGGGPKAVVQRQADEKQPEEGAAKLQRQAEPEEEGAAKLQRVPLKDKNDERIDSDMQRKPAAPAASAAPRSSTAPKSFASAIQGMRGAGRTLSAKVRGTMEKSFGYSFKDVRIHSNARAADANQKIRARAFTLGRDIYFNSGQYDPHSTEGKRLLAHELTHVIQQRGGQRK